MCLIGGGATTMVEPSESAWPAAIPDHDVLRLVRHTRPFVPALGAKAIDEDGKAVQLRRGKAKFILD